MATQIYPQYPPELTDEQHKYLVTNLIDWSVAHGLTVKPPSSFVSAEQDPLGVSATPAPVTLFPSLFPQRCYDEALAIQSTYNELYAAIAQDEDWLRSIVEGLLDIDDFVSQLWHIHLSVKEEGYVQDLALGMFRSDYMVHVDPAAAKPEPEIKQVEFNTIASSFGGLSTQVTAMHRHLLAIGAYPSQTASLLQTTDSLGIKYSRSDVLLAAGLQAAHRAYGMSRAGFPCCVIFLVQEPERNAFDQRHLEYALFNHHKTRSFRLVFNDILSHTRLTPDRTLIYVPPHSPDTHYEVTTVYFRAGYSPSDYTSPTSWAARHHLERSAAIKCPSILTHLAGSKKIQQVLATPNSPHLGRFLPDPITCARMRRTFAPIYPLDTSLAGLEARRLAMDPATAQRYVLKPQREGGGNNIYRGAIPEFLRAQPQTHWPAYILMEMIEPPPLKNAILRNGEIQQGGVIGELGVYGVGLWRHGKGTGDKGELLENFQAGYLLRTKGDTSEEGGVAAGFGAVDTACLVDV
ncbi:MAG: hypothetical protein M1821_008845 [Bathelium mastoideum]|nr:MAG: hypothetical protein M1821_008845 [Bathelium mastoideum]KAI9687579.1 MAG: hypothetical protein M1822_002189 [Bathelium mastoideum]